MGALIELGGAPPGDTDGASLGPFAHESLGERRELTKLRHAGRSSPPQPVRAACRRLPGRGPVRAARLRLDRTDRRFDGTGEGVVARVSGP